MHRKEPKEDFSSSNAVESAFQMRSCDDVVKPAKKAAAKQALLSFQRIEK
jgi:hypothetical protein